MTKATQEEPQGEATAEPVELIETQPDAIVVPAHEEPHVVAGSWAGLPNYGCSACSFATLDGEAAVEWHIYEAHTKKEV